MLTRSLALASLAALLAPTLEAQADRRTPHAIPFAQTENSIELELTGDVTTAEVIVVASPSWAVVRPGRIDANSEQPAVFEFDLLPSAPVGEPSALTFEIRTAAGRTVQHEVWVEASAPESFSVAPPRPNPVRGHATLPVEMPTAGHLRVETYDLLGRRVAVQHDGPAEAGGHAVPLEGGRLAPGMYLVRVLAELEDGAAQAEVRRVTIVR